MPEIQSIRDWSEPQCPVRIESRDEVTEEICRVSIEGLLALPRVGLGTGGLLLGSHDGHRIAITSTRPIHCAHSLGPAFRLSPDEMETARKEVDGHSVVGCYCSKPSGLKQPGESDIAFFDTFCPKPWQIMLQVKPSTIEPCRLVVYFRDSAGALVQGRERALVKGMSETPVSVAEPEMPSSPPSIRDQPLPVIWQIPAPPAFRLQASRGGQTVGITVGVAMAAAVAAALFFRVW